jgi:uncharacterized membrane protein
MSALHKKEHEIEKKRVWEVDALRGFLILSVLAYHLYMTVEAFCIDGYYSISSVDYVRFTDPLFFWFRIDEAGCVVRSVFPNFAVKYMQPLWVDMFFVVSGISYKFSRNNLKNGFRLLLGAAFVSLFTKLLVLYSGDESQFIRFGVLHCYAVCHLIHYFLLEERSNKALLPTAAVSLIVGYYLKFYPMSSNLALLVPFGIHEYGTVLRDYWPVFPMLGWFLIGVALGRKYYGEKVSLYPEQENKKWHKPLRFLGRHSGLIYCGHMVVYSVVFIAIGHIFALY